MTNPSYSTNYEILTALITYMAMDKYVMHQPQWFAGKLGIEKSKVTAVLKEFGSLFHESKSKSRDHEDHFYSLHLRYARQGVEDDDGNKVVRPPLELKDLITLLHFISNKAHEESNRGLTMRSTLIAALLSLLASVVALIAVFAGR